MKVKSSWRFILVSLLLLVGIGSAQGGVYDGWSFRMKIRVAGYNQAETLANFPALVILSTNIPGFLYTDFNSASNGADLRFAASNETTELNYEIEKWDTTGNSYVWVTLPTLASTNDYIYAYWGKAASAPACTTNGAVWDSNYMGVWHLGADFKDTTANANSGVNNGSTLDTGRIGSARALNGSQSVDIPDSATLDVSYITEEVWFKTTTKNAVYQRILDKAYNNGYIIAMVGDSSGKVGAWMNAKDTIGSGDLADGSWHYAVATYDGSIQKLYIDGLLQADTESWSGTITANAYPIGLGINRSTADGDEAFTGSIDEARVSNISRSPNWIYACWLNQASNGTFLAFSDLGMQSTSLAVRANPVTGLGSTQAIMGGTVMQTGNAENPDVYLCWGYTDGLTNATSAWAHVEALGTNWGVGQSFSTNITGLLSGSNYSYRCYVTNSTGYDWSDTAVSFQTLSLPVVTNLGANAIGGQIATLRGQITATGGETPSTWFLYWRDGSATTTTVAKGTQSGVFTTALSGLQIGSNYSYRCVASNGAGIAVSADQSFQTAAGEYIWSGNGADNKASTPGNWVQGVAPSETSDSIRLDNTSSKNMTWDITNQVAAWTQTADYTGTVTIDARYDGTLPGLFISGDCQVLGGNWTHPANGGAEVYRLRASIGGNFTLSASSALNADQKGYGQGQGPGSGSGGNNNGQPAASHGGMGADAYNTTYGSIVCPTNLGSGAFGLPGGAIWLTVNGSATIDGAITAQSQGGGTLAGGSGGSILIEAASLSGSGTLNASAALITSQSGQRGGGGGRIAVKLSGSSSFGSLGMAAYGARTADGVFGAAGTIYRQTSAQAEGAGTLVIDNAGTITLKQTLITQADSNLNAFSSIIITNRGILGLNSNSLLNLGSPVNLVVYGPAQSLVASPQTAGLDLAGDWTLSGYALQLYTNLDMSGNLLVTNGTLEMFADGQTNLHVGGNAIIAAGGSISHGINGGAEQYRLALQVDGDLTVEAGGAIDVTGKGYAPSQGPGAGYGSNNNNLPAASHGGLSAENIPYNPWASWVTYGSILAPTNLGSGGMQWGGGAAQVTVNGNTHLNGSMLAKGYPYWMAGNAGGSIYLTTGTLDGNGLIDASANSTDQYGGGGGRIAVILKNGNSFDAVTMQAMGAGSRRGAAGTVYRETLAQGTGRGVVTVNNGGVATDTVNTVTPVPPSLSTPLLGLKFVTLDATNYANISILTNMTMGNLFLRDDSSKLRLNGNTLTLKAVYHADWGTPSRVVYDGGEIIWDPGQGTIFSIR